MYRRGRGADYFLDLASQAKFLDNKIAVEQLIGLLGKHFSAEVRRGIVINKFTTLEAVEEYLREIDESYVVGGSNRAVANTQGEPMNRSIERDNHRSGHNRDGDRNGPPIVRNNNQGHNVRTLVCMEEPEVDLLSDPEEGVPDDEGTWPTISSTGYPPRYLQFGTIEVNPIQKFIKFPGTPWGDDMFLEEDRRVAFERLKDEAARRVTVAQAHRTKGSISFTPGDKVLVKTHPHSSAEAKLIGKFFLLYHGPYTVVEQAGPNSYVIGTPEEGFRSKENIINLKPYKQASDLIRN
nr:unnamed protein product [Callosobruchus analis]